MSWKMNMLRKMTATSLKIPATELRKVEPVSKRRASATARGAKVCYRVTTEVR